MKISKKSLLLAVVSIAIVVASFVVMLLDALIPIGIWVHPILTLLLCLFVGFGIMTLVMGFTSKSPWWFMISAILLGLALIYVIANVTPLWWIGLIAVIILWVIVALFSFISAGNKTESIALNKDPEYKDYNERKEEAKEAPEEKEELPELKRFS